MKKPPAMMPATETKWTTTSPWYEKPGFGRYRFRARFPEDVTAFYAAYERHRSENPTPKPNEEQTPDEKWRFIRESWALQIQHLLPLIETAEKDGDPWETWRDDIVANDCPYFLKRSLASFADYLFRDAAEQSTNGSDPPKGTSAV